MSRRDGATRGIWRFLLPASAVLFALLGGCRAHGDPDIAIAIAHVAAPQPATRLVVVLPGRADDLEDLQGSGIASAVQRAWPDADVVLAELTLDYYLAGSAIPRLHREIVAPVRKRYEAVWIVGASLGGMGALLYDREHPGIVDGLVLLVPYLGERALHDEIRAAGGPAAWRAGAPRSVDAGSWQRELWRHVQSLPTQPDAPRVWLAYGDGDRLRDAMPLLEQALPHTHVRIYDGSHDWTVWTAAAHDALHAARPH
jgi:pimeloyl-ACP methyl ester carboxylesterase